MNKESYFWFTVVLSIAITIGFSYFVLSNQHINQVEYSFLDDLKVDSEIINSYMMSNDLVIKYNNPDNELVNVIGISEERYKVEKDLIIIYNFDKEDYFEVHIGEDSDVYKFGKGVLLSKEKSYKIKDVKIGNKKAKEITFDNLSKDYKIKEEADKEGKKAKDYFKLEKTKYFGDVDVKLMEKINVTKERVKRSWKCNCTNKTINETLNGTKENKTIEKIKEVCDTCREYENYTVEEMKKIDPETFILKKNKPIYEVFEGCSKIEKLPDGKWGCSVWTDVNIFGVNIEGATWFNNSWSWRKEINISNTAGNQTNYQVQIELNSSNFNYSHANTTGKDVRFTNSTDSELDYWIELWNISGSSYLWVEVPTLANDTNTSIYLYYGNSEVGSESNGTATFEFFDDFEGASLNTDKWDENTLHNGGVSVSDSSLVMNLNYGAHSGVGVTADSTITSDNWIIEGRGMRESGGYKTGEPSLYLGFTDKNSRDTIYYGDYNYHSFGNLYECPGNNHRLESQYDDQSAWGSTAIETWDDKWVRFTITYLHTDKKVKTRFVYGNEEVTIGPTSSATHQLSVLYPAIHFGSYQEYDENSYCDWYAVRKYASPEPTVSIGSEETAPVVSTVTLNSPANETITNDNTTDFNFTYIGGEPSASCELIINGNGYGKLGDCECPGTGYETYNVSGNIVYVDCNADKCWTSTQGEYSWSNAISHCSGLNYGSSTNWVLPNSTALQNLCNSSSCSGTCFGGDGDVGRYWSSTEYIGSDAYSVEFSDCNVYLYDKVISDSVRCVSNTNFEFYGVPNNTPTVITANHSITPDGTYNWYINCTAGGITNPSEIRQITIDTQNPAISITYPTSNSILNTYIINGTSTDTNLNYTNISIKQGATIINSTTNTSSSWSVSLYAPDGVYNITATAYDNATNSNTTTITNITIDTTPPAITLNTTASDENSFVNRNWSYQEAYSTENLNGSFLDWNGTNETATIDGMRCYLNKTDLPDGNYTYKFWVNDSTGNWNSTDTYWTYIDITPPNTTATAVDENNNSYTFGDWTNSNYVNVTLNCSDNCECNVTQYCLDTGNSCTPNLTYSTPVYVNTTGTSYIRFNSNDSIGNLETTNSETIKIDLSTPTIAINNPENITYYTTSVPVNVSVSDNNGFECNITEDGSLLHTSTENETWTTTLTKNGTSHNVSVFCMDAAGNNITNTTYYFVWSGLNISVYYDNGSAATNWNVSITNTTNTTTGTYNNSAMLEWDEIPYGEINLTFDDGSPTLYYFQNITSTTNNETNYQELNISLIAKASNPLNLTSSEGWNIYEIDVTTLQCTAPEGTPILKYDGGVVPNPYIIKPVIGTHEVYCEVSVETENYKPTNTSNSLVVNKLVSCISSEMYAFNATISTSTNITTLNFGSFVTIGYIKSDVSDVRIITNVSNVWKNTTNGSYLVVNNTNLSSFTVEFGNYIINNSYENHATENIVTISDYTQQNPYVFYSLLDEITREEMFPPNATLSTYIFCDSGEDYIKIQDNNTRFLIAVKDYITQVNIKVWYSVNEYYSRNLLPSEADALALNFYVVDAYEHALDRIDFNMIDVNYYNSKLQVYKKIQDQPIIITEGNFDVSHFFSAYLIEDKEYLIRCIDSGETTEFGTILVVEPGTKELGKQTINLNPQAVLIADNILMNAWADENMTTLYLQYEDDLNQTDELNISVYFKNGTIFQDLSYSNLSSLYSTYNISGYANETYWVEFRVEHQSLGNSPVIYSMGVGSAIFWSLGISSVWYSLFAMVMLLFIGGITTRASLIGGTMLFVTSLIIFQIIGWLSVSYVFIGFMIFLGILGIIIYTKQGGE